MVFNPDPTKQAGEVIFSGTLHSLKHTDLYSNNVVAQKVEIQNYLGLKLDKKQNFREQLKHKFAIVHKEIGRLKKLSNYLLCHSLVIFIKPLNDLI